jgi:hypothetical protein
LTGCPRAFLHQISPQFDGPSVSLAIRTEGAPASLAAEVSQAIQRLNPDLPAITAETAQLRLRMWLEPQRAAALLLGVLGFAALGLVITGLYALLAQLLVQRTPEIAVRVALGASRDAVLVLLLRQSAIRGRSRHSHSRVPRVAHRPRPRPPQRIAGHMVGQVSTWSRPYKAGTAGGPRYGWTRPARIA